MLSNEARRLNDFCMVLQKFVKRGEGKESTSLLLVRERDSILAHSLSFLSCNFLQPLRKSGSVKY
jgi:hypothetical protein